MHDRSKCMSGLVFPPSKEGFQFWKQKEITRGKVWGYSPDFAPCDFFLGEAVRQNSYFFFLQKGGIYCGGMRLGIVMEKKEMFKTNGRVPFLIYFFSFFSTTSL